MASSIGRRVVVGKTLLENAPPAFTMMPLWLRQPLCYLLQKKNRKYSVVKERHHNNMPNILVYFNNGYFDMMYLLN